MGDRYAQGTELQTVDDPTGGVRKGLAQPTSVSLCGLTYRNMLAARTSSFHLHGNEHEFLKSRLLSFVG